MPSLPALVLDHDTYMWAMRERLALNAVDVGQACQSSSTTTGVPCHACLDLFGRHPLICAHGQSVRRHNSVRNIVAQFARSAGLQTFVEQRNAFESQTDHPDHDVRALHTADIQLLDPQRGQCWIDLRLVTSSPHESMSSQLTKAERKKLAEYGIRSPPSLSLFDQLAPCVLESAGCLGDSARQTFAYLHRTKVDHMMTSLGASRAYADFVCQRELLQPVGVLLQRMAYQAYALSTGKRLPMRSEEGG